MSSTKIMSTSPTTSETIRTENVTWDLSFIYSGITDPTLDSDISKLIEMMKEFNATHKGNLAESLGKAITDYSEISMLNSKVSEYLFLKQSQNVSDAAVKTKVAGTEQIVNQVQGEYMTFFMIELVALSDEKMKELYEQDPIVARHKPWLEYTRILKPHLLSESVESALTKRASFGSDAWAEFFNELESDLEFTFHTETKTFTEMLHILSTSHDREERAEVLYIINEKLGGAFGKYSAQTLFMIAGAHAVENIERGFKHPMQSRNISNQVSDEVVDILHTSVEQTAAPLAERYYKLKAKHLGLETLKWSDRNAPIPFSDTSVVPFDEALSLVLGAYESFSPTLAQLIRDMVSKKRIDAPATKNKEHGAYNCSLILPGNSTVSFTLLNYLGSNHDVMTLAHELGHGVHAMLAGEAQGPLMSSPPFAYCETASIFGERITFNNLKKRLEEQGDKKSLLALTMSKIDDAMNSSVRQIGFSNFERRLHGMDSLYKNWETVQKLSLAKLDEIWMETIQQLYGKEGEVFTYENTEHLWAYVSHFHRPFYVYGYAFGQFLTDSIYAQSERLGEKFEPLYLDMLRAGSTKDIVELLKPLGLNPLDPEFWNRGIEAGLGSLIREAEELSKEMGIL